MAKDSKSPILQILIGSHSNSHNSSENKEYDSKALVSQHGFRGKAEISALLPGKDPKSWESCAFCHLCPQMQQGAITGTLLAWAGAAAALVVT